MSDLQGSCFCGAVAFAAQADIGQGTMRCNCRFCRKMRYWEVRLPDPDSFRLIRGAEALAETCLLYTSPSPRDRTRSRMPSSA